MWSSNPSPTRICQRQIQWRTLMEGRLHLAERLLGNLLRSTLHGSMDTKNRDGNSTLGIRPPLLRRTQPIQRRHRQSHLTRNNPARPTGTTLRRPNQESPDRLDCRDSNSGSGHRRRTQHLPPAWSNSLTLNRPILQSILRFPRYS